MQQRQPQIIIAIMGMTGTGKSTFINTLCNHPNVAVGTGLHSCTQEIQCVKILYKSYRVTLVDTPGFDDTDRDDGDVLNEIASWLYLQRKKELKLTGLIYLHRITDNRVGSTAVRNLRLLRALVGEDNMRNLVLVTNRWEDLPSKERGEELLQNDLLGPGPPPGFWNELVTLGADHAKHDGTKQSARAIIGRIVERSPIYLRIQEELHAGARISQTAASQVLIGELLRTIQEMERKTSAIEKQLAKVAEENAALMAALSQLNVQGNEAKTDEPGEDAILLEALSHRRQDIRDNITKCEAAIQKLKSDDHRLESNIAKMEARPTWTLWDVPLW